MSLNKGVISKVPSAFLILQENCQSLADLFPPQDIAFPKDPEVIMSSHEACLSTSSVLTYPCFCTVQPFPRYVALFQSQFLFHFNMLNAPALPQELQ